MASLVARLRARSYDQVTVGALHAVAIALISAMVVVSGLTSGHWLAGHDGGDIVDFSAFWASARASWGGHAVWAYDWGRLQPILEASFHHAVSGRAPVYYPPSLLLAIAPMGALPYGVAISAWCLLGLGGFVAVAWKVLPRRATLVIALAAPGVLANLLVGQNGLFTAVLIGGGLLLLERRPLLAGVLFGALCFKPQMALLVPLALLAGGRWRALAAMAATALAALALSWLLFGSGTFEAFLAASRSARIRFAHEGWLSWAKVQTVFGAVRQFGGDPAQAMAAQVAAAMIAAAALVWLWRSRADFALKAAALCAATLLATPYAFTYDAPVLGLGVLFLLRDAREHGSLPLPLAACAAVSFLAPFFANPAPTIAPAAALLLGVVAWRADAWPRRVTKISPPPSHPSARLEASF